MIAKRIILRLALCAEVATFGIIYFTSPSGFKALSLLSTENQELQLRIADVEKDLARLRSEISDWGVYAWYKERMAREELQMAYPGEEIFLID